MEIEGSVKLLENVHNIWIAWKSAISSQTGYRTRTNIVPKLLKNAVKTVFAFCVFYNGRIYLSIPSEAKKCFLQPMFMKRFAFFVCASLFLHIRLNITCLGALKSGCQRVQTMTVTNLEVFYNNFSFLSFKFGG